MYVFHEEVLTDMVTPFSILSSVLFVPLSVMIVTKKTEPTRHVLDK